MTIIELNNLFPYSNFEYLEQCEHETSFETFGKIEWYPIVVNRTAHVPCPFGHEGEVVQRNCIWDNFLNKAIWESIGGDQTCRKQVF